MHKEMIEGIKLLGAYTANSFDPWDLAGPSKASCRAHIMSAIEGHRVPQSKSGVTTIRDRLWNYAKPEGGCISERQDSFEKIARAALQAEQNKGA